MIRKKVIVLAAIVSTILCACTRVEEMNKSEVKAEGSEFQRGVENEETAIESNAVSAESGESRENKVETNSFQTEFIPFASTDTFEYDATNNCVILNGDSYNISTNEMDCYAGYMFYLLTNGTMEDIRDSINNNVLQKKYWRESYTEELLEKVKESTMLEDFTENGGKILNYYILNSPGFLSAFELAQMPVVVEYSFNGKTYHSIWVFCVSHTVENEEVVYQITDIFYLDAMNGWGLED